MKHKRIILIITIIAALSGAAWFFSVGFPESEIRNVVLISIDTCRADHLSCYGFSKKTTPNIDALAENSVLFKNVITPIPETLPSHSSMLTGTIPPYHGVHANNGYQLDEFNITLAEILKGKGFTTGAIISAFVLDSQFGVSQGFDTYNDRFEGKSKTDGGISERKGEETSRFAVEWLQENKDERFFLFLHYFDPHQQYEPPQPFANEYASDLYSGEIAYTDYCIGQVISKLKKLGLYDSTLIVITADHGEMLGEHGELTHAYFIYQGNIRIPLIFKLPGKNQANVITERVGLIDIVPTVCGLLGMEPPPEVQGLDLSAALKGKKLDSKSRYLYTESLTPTLYNANSLLGVLDNRFKYIQTTRPELYDLSEDPQEIDNLIEKETQRARVFQDKLAQILEESVHKGGPGSKLEMDQQALEKLKGLGYIGGGGVEENFEFDQNKEDPKDLIKLHTKHTVVIGMVARENYGEAEKLCNEILAERPDFPEAFYSLGEINKERGNPAEAITNFQQALKIKPDHELARRKLGMLFLKQDRFDEAIEQFQIILKDSPDSFQSHDFLARAFSKQGKLDQAIEHFDEAIRIQPDNAIIHFDMSQFLAKQGNYDLAVTHLKKAIEIHPDMADAYQRLGAIYRRMGKPERVVSSWKQFLEIEPDSPKILNDLAWILAASADRNLRNPSEAIEFAERASELTGYQEPMILDTLAVAYAAAGRFDQAEAMAQTAVEQLRQAGKNDLADDIGTRLKLYRRKETYTEPGRTK